MNLDNLPSDEHLRSRWTAIESAIRPRPASRLRRTSVIGLLVVGLVGGSSFAAYAAHEASVTQAADEIPADVQAQIALAPLLDEEDAWFQRFYNVAVGPGKADSDNGWPARYGGSAIDTDTRVVTVWWVGTPPRKVVDFLAEPTTEFTVELKSVSVSKRDLDRAARTIFRADQKHPFVRGLYVSSFSHTADRTGLVIHYALDGEKLPPDAEHTLLVAARELVDVRVVRARKEVVSFLPAIVDNPFPDPPGGKPAISWTGPSRD